MCPTCHEGIHIEEFLFIGLLSVDNGHLVRREREGRHDLLVSLLQVAVVHFIAFKDQGIDHKDLPPGRDLFPHELP